jgi:hypothetical protein
VNLVCDPIEIYFVSSNRSTCGENN